MCSPRIVLFFSNYRRFTGGHLKTRHYLDHVRASSEFAPRIWFEEGSTWEQDELWHGIQALVVPRDDPVRPSVLCVGGRNWWLVDQYPHADSSVPIINIVQHVRHADPANKRFPFLGRKAIRICVSPEVAEAVVSAGAVGPAIVVPNGLDIAVEAVADSDERPVDLLIAGLKQPQLAVQVAEALSAPGRAIEVLTEQLARGQFLNAMRRARATLFLPNDEEGFFLPALEGMALGTVVVCPDCVGNRSFCLPGINALRPAYRLGDVLHAAEAALTLGESEVAALRAAAQQTARRHSLEAEREAFLDVLHRIDELWGSADGSGGQIGREDTTRQRPRHRRGRARSSGVQNRNVAPPPTA